VDAINVLAERVEALHHRVTGLEQDRKALMEE
jgi:hypothetical protein